MSSFPFAITENTNPSMTVPARMTQGELETFIEVYENLKKCERSIHDYNFNLEYDKYEESELSDQLEEANTMVTCFNSEVSILYLYMNQITRDDIKNHENSVMYFAYKWIVNFAQGRYDQLYEELCKYTTKKIVKSHELPIGYS